ncbi:TetR/AcrR family transcriptional regulator [Amycolatopsis pithecellobii]|uniref:TetR/AcrR family transcriptional regulator n=1 Tax=Amycolatopsis pithecellobii TaxID=664692 RepID=UPI0028A73918|nr:helix-turn-helix domain-containing protein [Amycolatopsis pithecellobii]
MTAQPRTRSDARANRERIVAAARTAFAADGLEVPIREIARHAGVGVATVYRHFPAKEALLRAAFAEQLASCASIVEEGLAQDDPWRGFGLVTEKLMEMHARDRGFARAFTSRLPATAGRDRTLRLLLDLIRRAKEAGKLRPDFVLEDLILALMSNEGIQAATPGLRAKASRRFAALMVQSFQTRPGLPPLPPAVRLPLIAEQAPSLAHRSG